LIAAHLGKFFFPSLRQWAAKVPHLFCSVNKFLNSFSGKISFSILLKDGYFADLDCAGKKSFLSNGAGSYTTLVSLSKGF